jgi:hypothetical protein
MFKVLFSARIGFAEGATGALEHKFVIISYRITLSLTLLLNALNSNVYMYINTGISDNRYILEASNVAKHMSNLA